MAMHKYFMMMMLVLINQQVLALDFEKLFMPGDVIDGHKKLETECQQCHVRMRETTQNKLCLDCHEKIAADVNNKSGFHGKSKQATSKDCKDCHTDHKGRQANIIWLDKDRFDHDLTDYPLQGKHQQSECITCHKKDKKYREVSSTCIACHKEDDAHKNKLGEKCGSCHNSKSWTSEQFDHDKTDFKLNHAHQKVACDLCHVENQYKDTPKKCFSCHTIKDVHQNRFGNQCQDCHNEKKWSESKFDHDKDTKYRLKGKHRSLTCHSCHTIEDRKKNKSKKQKQNRDCNSCHLLDDTHKGKNGDKCDQCHEEQSWLKSSFDHDEKTEFALKGAHKKASCQACHQSDEKDKKTDKACYSCHRHEDVHEGQEGEVCNDCHNDESWWMENVRFDHELSDFPLIGQHAVVGCESCHLSSTFKDVKKSCNSCHQADDIHKQALGENCQQCHNPNDWLIWSFEHDETDFKLKGAHVDMHCHSCHFKPLDKDKKNSSHCIDCHHRDDIHDGNFGSNCGQCHTQDDFKTIDIRSISGFGQ
jgi:hypothetical protein